MQFILYIFIGGFKLDRGITIDHMLGFMYGRNPQVRQADAVLQHHRMYGNRSKEDMAVTRLHTTQSLYNTMEWIDNMDHQLREIFVKAMQHPNDPVPMITIQYDRTRGVRPCATNKLLISDLETLIPSNVSPQQDSKLIAQLKSTLSSMALTVF